MTLFLPVIRLHSFHALVEEPADDSWWHRHAQWQWRFLQQNFTFWSLQVQSVATSVVVCRQFYVMLCTVVDNMETSYNSFGITVRRVIMPFVWRKSVLILTAVKRLCDHLGHKVFTNIQLEWHCIALLCWCAVKKLLTHSPPPLGDAVDDWNDWTLNICSKLVRATRQPVSTSHL